MRTTIDRAGRLVIPKVLRDQVGLRAGEVEIVVVGAAIRVEPVGDDHLTEADGHLFLADGGNPVTADDVRSLRLADQR